MSNIPSRTACPPPRVARILSIELGPKKQLQKNMILRTPQEASSLCTTTPEKNIRRTKLTYACAQPKRSEPPGWVTTYSKRFKKTTLTERNIFQFENSHTMTSVYYMNLCDFGIVCEYYDFSRGAVRSGRSSTSSALSRRRNHAAAARTMPKTLMAVSAKLTAAPQICSLS